MNFCDYYLVIFNHKVTKNIIKLFSLFFSDKIDLNLFVSLRILNFILRKLIYNLLYKLYKNSFIQKTLIENDKFYIKILKL